MEPPYRSRRPSLARRLAGRLVAGPIFAALAVAGLFAWSQQPGALARVPDVVGVDAPSARLLLTQAGFGAHIVERPGPGVPGTVVEQEPAADTFHERMEGVTLVVTLGAEQVPVPEVTSMPTDEARDILARAGLATGAVVYRHHPGQEPGRVVRTEPEAGRTVDAGTEVTIHAALPE